MTSIPLWSMKQAGSLPSYSFLFLGKSSGVWRRTAPVEKHQALMLWAHFKEKRTIKYIWMSSEVCVRKTLAPVQNPQRFNSALIV